MSILKEGIEQADHDALVRIVVDTFRRIVFHYGAWFAEVAHQVHDRAVAVAGGTFRHEHRRVDVDVVADVAGQQRQ